MNKSTDRYLSWYVRKLTTKSDPAVEVSYTSAVNRHKVVVKFRTYSTALKYRRRNLRTEGKRRMRLGSMPGAVMVQAEPRFPFPTYEEIREVIMALGFTIRGGHIGNEHLIEFLLKGELMGKVTLL